MKTAENTKPSPAAVWFQAVQRLSKRGVVQLVKVSKREYTVEVLRGPENTIEEKLCDIAYPQLNTKTKQTTP